MLEKIKIIIVHPKRLMLFLKNKGLGPPVKHCKFHYHHLRCDSFYNIPSTLGKSQASGIGRGNKISLSRNVDAPSPNKYTIKSSFNQKITGGKIGIGR